jgi:hypothetical protein
MTSVVSVQRPWLERIGPIPGWGPLVPFLAISAQLAALLVLLRLFQIEPGTGLLTILPLIFVGFVVHAALPMRWRLPFFLLLSFAAIGIVLGPVAGAVLVLAALLLIGTCHLPVAFSTRVLLLLLMIGVLAAIRANWLAVPPAVTSSLALPTLPKMVLPVLASMFMFRLIIYLYDLRHEERARASGTPIKGVAAQPASVWTRLSYFFLLPNVCFLLFPIVDYRTYRRTYYDTDAQAIYQKGVWWICLGLVQLLLYRVVYQYLVPAPEDVQGLAGIVRFMLSAYLIYFRVVGQFQLIIGLLCLFGFNLPAAHRFYLLASSFTDFWRRARIEWKDFMVKIFYYPALVPLQRKLGATLALIVATVWVFFVTWLLHGYQWFWLIGDFRVLGNDAVFWTLIGGCVLVNSLLEVRKGRARAGSRWDTGRAVVHAAKVVGMFVFMCVLWSYWSSPSFSIWVSYLTAAKESGPGAYGLLVAVVLAVIAAGVLAQFIAFRIAAGRSTRAKAVIGAKPRAPLQPVSWAALAWRPAAVLTAAAVLLLTQVPTTRQALGASATDVVSTLSADKLNAVDQEREDRGYYEELLDVPRSTAALAASAGSLKDAAAGNTPAGDAASEEPTGDGSAADTTAQAPAGKAPAGSTNGNAGAEPTKSHEEETPEAPVAGGPAAGQTQAGAATNDMSAGEAKKPGSRNPEAIQPARTESGPEKPNTAAADSGQSISPGQKQLPASGVAGKPIRRKVVGRRLRPYEQMTNSMTMWENAPNYVGSFKDAPVRTNRWGMRDKDYTLVPSPRTYRMALLGSSMTVGAGVPAEQSMESLLEDQFNRDGPGAPRRRYEILNFSVGAYGIMQNVALLDEKVLAFKPNAVLVGVFSVDGGRMGNYLSKLVRADLPIPYPYVREKLRQAGVNASMDTPELLRRLDPVSEDLVKWSYQHIIEVCRQRGIAVVGMVLPEPIPKAGHDIDQAARLATAAGLPLLDLRGVYGGQSADSFRLYESGDPHWNARGHKLIADRIYELLREKDARALRLGFKARTTGNANPPTVSRPPAMVDASPAMPVAGLAILASQPRTSAAPQVMLAARRTSPTTHWTILTAREAPPAAQWRALTTPTLSAPEAGERELRQQIKGPWIRMTGDFLEFELRPSYTVSYQGQFPFSTNRWGMRDKDYSLAPPPLTYRIALLGMSVEMGAGVPVDKDYESVLEARLNREGPQAPRRHYEILNFAVGGYSILQQVVVAERKVLPFAPNAIMLAIHPLEPRPTSRLLISLIRSKTPIPYPYVAEKLRQAGVEPTMREPEMRRRLQPVLDDIVRWGYQRIAGIAKEHKLPVIAVVVPRSDMSPAEVVALAKQAQIAAGFGMKVLSLEGAFGAHDSVNVPPTNTHPNPLGHQLLADRLYSQLRANDARGLKLGFGN